MRRPAALLPALCACLLLGCSGGPEHEREIGEAFAGPATLKLRQGIDPRSAEAATVKHGDRLAIVGRRRRFVKVRTAQGVEGWTDMRQLLSPEQMEALDKLAEKARSLPSQGAGTVYEALNLHTEPNRFAPSFYRIKERETVDLVASQLSPRVPFEPKNILPPQVKTGRRPKAEPSARVPPPPMPAAPELPENWLELSETAPPEPLPGPAPPPKPGPEPAKAIPVDDWSLVRLANGRAGWVLTGMLRMNIPDEVAQYSEGHRITAYFAMADIKDGDQIKHNWLWTTLAKTHQPYQFDSFRYFIWNLRRHRYETTHIEQNLKGYYPVEVHPVKMTVAKQEETLPGFSLIVEDDAGVRWRKTYAFLSYRVVLMGKEKQEPPSSAEPAPTGLAGGSKPVPPSPSVYARVQQTLAAWKRKVFGK